MDAPIVIPKRAKQGCCRGCDRAWKDSYEGKCRRCGACGNCCGKSEVYRSCAYRSDHSTPATRERRERSTEGYWHSVDTGKQFR